MSLRHTAVRVWTLLPKRQKRRALALLGLLVVSAFASAVMVAAIFPFLALISDPSWGADRAVVIWFRDAFGLTSDYRFVFAVGLLSVAAILLGNALLVARTVATQGFTQYLILDLSRSILHHYLAQPYVFFLNRHSGDLSTVVLSETQQAVGQFLNPAMICVASGLTIIAVSGSVIAIEPAIGLAAFAAIGGCYFLLLRLTRKHMRSFGVRRAKANAARYQIVGEAFGGSKDIKLLGLEREYARRFSEPAAEMARVETVAQILQASPRFAIQAIVFSGVIFVCLLLVGPDTLGTEGAAAGLLPLLGLMALAAQRLMPEISEFYRTITLMRFGAAAVDRLWGDLSQAVEQRDLPAAAPQPLRLTEALELDRVTFRYPGSEQAGLHDLSLSIRAGDRVGIVGATGAGKTTLADIILGLLTPTSGEIRADGTGIDTQTLRAWQRSVSYVPQDIFLLDASIAENIALGAQGGDIDRGRVERAARRARLHDFIIDALPHGYDTETGERGVRLSGGQRQRVGIARALYRDSDLIVLDEATSALDNLTEAEVMQAIEALPGDKTLVMIAHRLSTLQRCNRIVLLEAGRVIAEGSWDDLLETSPAFRSFARAAGMTQLDEAS